MDGEDQLKAVLLEQNQFFEQENSDLRRQLHRCQADAAAAATAAAAQAAAAAAQAAAAAAADQSRLEKQHQLEDKVAELEKALRRRERGQGSSAGSTKDEEVPALHIAAQLAAADPAAAEAPQPAEAGAGEGQGADAAVDDLSIPLSSLGLAAESRVISDNRRVDTHISDTPPPANSTSTVQGPLARMAPGKSGGMDE